MKRKLKIMNHQIDQLKEEISAKEAALVKEHLEHQRVEKDKEALKSKAENLIFCMEYESKIGCKEHVKVITGTIT